MTPPPGAMRTSFIPIVLVTVSGGSAASKGSGNTMARRRMRVMADDAGWGRVGVYHGGQGDASAQPVGQTFLSVFGLTSRKRLPSLTLPARQPEARSQTGMSAPRGDGKSAGFR